MASSIRGRRVSIGRIYRIEGSKDEEWKLRKWDTQQHGSRLANSRFQRLGSRGNR